MKAAVLSAIVGVASAQNVIYRPRVGTTTAAPVRVAGAPIRYGAMPTTTVAAAPRVISAPRPVAAPKTGKDLEKVKFNARIAQSGVKGQEKLMLARSVNLYNTLNVPGIDTLDPYKFMFFYDAYSYGADINQDKYDNLMVQDDVDWKAVHKAKQTVDWSEDWAEAHQWRMLGSPAFQGLFPGFPENMASIMWPYKFRDHVGIKRDMAAQSLDLLVQKADKNPTAVKDWELAAAYDHYDAVNNMHDFWTFNTLNAMGVLPSGNVAGIPNIYALPTIEASNTWADLAYDAFERAEDAYMANPSWESYSKMKMAEYTLERREAEEIVRIGQTLSIPLLVTYGFYGMSEASSAAADLQNEIAADAYYEATGRYPVDYYDY